MAGMDSQIRCFTVSEQMLFNFSEYVDLLLKENPDVKAAGVFKLLPEEKVKNLGTSLNDLLQVDKSRLMAVQKQFVVGVKDNPNLYGYRGFRLPEEDLNISAMTKVGVISCSANDVTAFIRTATNPRSYMATTCCSDILESDGEEAAVDHFLRDVLPSMALERKIGTNKEPLSKTVARGKKDAKDYKKFHTALVSLSVDEKLKLVHKGLDVDRRDSKLECGCSGCSHEGHCLEAKTKSTGIMYGAGIELTNNDRIKMTKNFGLFCLPATSILRLLKHHYAGITHPFLYFGLTHSIFPIHIEDGSLFSINYLHYGAPKVWICVQPKAVLKLHLCLSGIGVDLSQTTCSNLLGHKFLFPTIQWLNDNEIPHKVVIQKAGECVVVTPNTAHFGFNLGTNIAEAANFPTYNWIPYGIVAPKCACIGLEVHFDMERIIAALRPDFLEDYRTNKIPAVSEKEDPDFYQSILRVNPKSFDSFPKGETVPKGSIDDGDESDQEQMDMPNEDSVFPSLPKKPKGRRVLACPKATCKFVEYNGKKQRLSDHVKTHKGEPTFNKIQKEFDLMFPLRNKTKSKRTCSKCGKVVAGRGGQLRIHQNGTGCIKRDH